MKVVQAHRQCQLGVKLYENKHQGGGAEWMDYFRKNFVAGRRG